MGLFTKLRKKGYSKAYAGKIVNKVNQERRKKGLPVNIHRKKTKK